MRACELPHTRQEGHRPGSRFPARRQPRQERAHVAVRARAHPNLQAGVEGATADGEGHPQVEAEEARQGPDDRPHGVHEQCSRVRASTSRPGKPAGIHAAGCLTRLGRFVGT